MTTDTILRDVRVLIDRYVEMSAHYARELRNYSREYENSPSRLSTLISRLEAIESAAIDPTRIVAPAAEEPALGQNIVRTEDTLAALRSSANEILERLDNPIAKVPRNWFWLKKWLHRDVAEIAAGFPSFTYAWDMLIDLNRLTLVPDSKFLRVRDNVSLATMEFERFVIALRRLALSVEAAEGSLAQVSDTGPDDNAETALQSLCTPLMALLDSRFDERVKRALSLLQRPKESLEDESIAGGDAGRDVDALALLGLELGFTRWLDFADPSKEHRKTIIMSLLVCSKLFLVEGSWRNAKEFSAFALALTTKMNADLDLPTNEGTPMLRFNRLWAEHKLGENIRDELDQWDVTELSPRYSFLKFVLLRNFEEAVRLLETLLPKKNSGEPGNFSMMEAEEWPILEDLRSSTQYEALKQKLSKSSS